MACEHRPRFGGVVGRLTLGLETVLLFLTRGRNSHVCSPTQAKEECSAHADVLLLLSMRQMTLPIPMLRRGTRDRIRTLS